LASVGKVSVKKKVECTNVLPDDGQKGPKHILIYSYIYSVDIHTTVMAEHNNKNTIAVRISNIF
jgi:hypothetical protein